MKIGILGGDKYKLTLQNVVKVYNPEID